MTLDSQNGSSETPVDRDPSPSARSVPGELAAAKTRITELELRLLSSRDFAIGAEAETARMRWERDEARARYRQMRDQFRRARRERKELRGRVRDLEEQIEDLRSSRAWRVGRMIAAPLSALRHRSRA